MGLVYAQVKLGGTEVDATRSTRCRPNRLSVGYEGRDTFEFTDGPGLTPAPRRTIGASVEVRLDRSGSNRCAFRGSIVAVNAQPLPGGGYVHNYTCLGKQLDIDRIPILTASDSGTRYVFNAPRDSEDYAASRSGKSVGQIIKAVLNDQSSKLSAIGVSLTYVNAFETELTQNPLDPVEVSGEGLWNWLQGFMRQWAPNHRAYLEYTDTGTEIRIKDLSDLTSPTTLTIGQDLIDPPTISYSIDSCASKVEGLGEDEIRPHELGLLAEEMEEVWDSGDEGDWTLSDFEAEGDAVDEGSITSMTDETVTLESDDSLRSWGEDYWAGDRQGKILVRDTSISGVESQFLGFISANDSLGAGGSCDVTVDHPFDQTGYDRYKLYGRRLLREHVWRKYRPTNTDVRAALRSRFPYDVTFRFNAGSAALQGQRYPMAFGIKDDVPHQLLCEIDQGTGDVWLMEPCVTHQALGNSREDLLAGTVTTQFDDIRFFLPVSNGPLRVSYPESGYEGNLYDWHGLEITRPIRLASWRDPGARDQIQQLCQEVHKSISTPIATTTVSLHGYAGAAWFPLGKAVTLAAKAAPGGATVSLGHVNDIVFAVHGVDIQWGGNDGMRVSLRLSNERRPTTNLDLYTHSARGRYEGGFMQYQGLPSEGQEFGGADLSAVESDLAFLNERISYTPLAGIQASYSNLSLGEQRQAGFDMFNAPMLSLAKQGKALQSQLPASMGGPAPPAAPRPMPGVGLGGFEMGAKTLDVSPAGIQPVTLRPYNPRSRGLAGRPFEGSLGREAQAQYEEDLRRLSDW